MIKIGGEARGPSTSEIRSGCWWQPRPYADRGRRRAATQSRSSHDRQTGCPTAWADGRSQGKSTARIVDGLRRHAPNLTDDTSLAHLTKSPEESRAVKPAQIIKGRSKAATGSTEFSGALTAGDPVGPPQDAIPGLYRRTAERTRADPPRRPGAQDRTVLLAELGQGRAEVMSARGALRRSKAHGGTRR